MDLYAFEQQFLQQFLRLWWRPWCLWRNSGGVLGVCGAMASEWSREDFFRIAAPDIHKLKLQLAQKCDIHYDLCNQEKNMGFTSNGVMGLTAATLATRVKAMQEMMVDTTLSGQEKSSKLLDAHTFATVISGCHVKWATTTVLNTGYIMEAGAKMVASWDSSVERRAGGFDD